VATCLTECRALPDLDGYTISDYQGEHVQCRLFHVSAATAEPDYHCEHALGSAPCAVPDGGS
jgi:hypothetical protein